LNWLAEGFSAWRRLGPRRGTVAAARYGLGLVSVPARRTRVRLLPPRVTPRSLRRALGGASVERAVRDTALAALPTVAAWERELDALTGARRAALIEHADRICAHRFDLLGSGPTDLGAQLDWQRDFKSGKRWPDVHISRVPAVLGGGSDIKVPWELSRCQHLPLLPAAYRLTGERRYLDELGAELSSFIDSNPVEFGAPWACTMDVGIRAANWVAALCMALPAAAPATWVEPALASLLLHCRFIRGHLEWGETRGNHYLSDVVGLLAGCVPFSAGAEGREWAAWAAAQLEQEMFHQVRPDGCDHEASIPYHRLVAELFVCGTHAAEALCPGSLSDEYRERLRLMLGFVSDYTRPDGLAPQIGDADDGRFLPLGDYGSDPRDHRHLFWQAARRAPAPRGHVAFPDGGYYVMRHDPLWCLVRCGDVGLNGIGGHAHNDQLSFELAFGAQPLIVDPGSYLYTADPAARNEFRSTRAHSTVRVGGAEQNPLRSDYLFSLRDDTQARCLRFDLAGPNVTFAGEHTGFHSLARSVRHRRELRFDGDARELLIADTVSGANGEELEWTFPLAPCEVTTAGSSAVARFPGVCVEMRAEGLELQVEHGWLAPSYGVRTPAPVIRARRTASSDEETARVVLAVSGDAG
jgi:hypothetical protein